MRPTTYFLAAPRHYAASPAHDMATLLADLAYAAHRSSCDVSATDLAHIVSIEHANAKVCVLSAYH